VETHSHGRGGSRSEYEELRARHVATFEALFPDFLARIELVGGSAPGRATSCFARVGGGGDSGFAMAPRAVGRDRP
jgi:hypothetical protein